MKNNLLSVLVFTISLLLLGGCKANQDSLEEYVQKMKLSAAKEVQALAPAMIFKASAYQQYDSHQPFSLPPAALVVDQPVINLDCWQPTQRKKHGKLERYPLTKLKLRGVIGDAGQVSALIQTPQGHVIRVQKGQYVGLNNGKVTQINSHQLVLKEILPDGLGCWNSRSVTLAMK
ncbi:pilus assembly protein PilP [Vibrio sp. FNV 38]|nr:pilus assembly protein PilP [Vibrio sp. FNV 38]